jgi:hypothetical protein
VVRQARAAAAAAKSDEAARMAGQALAMDPGNQEAKQILASLKAADLEHMKRAAAALEPVKGAAIAAGASELASQLFAAAEKQEQSAAEAGSRQQYAMAAARLEAATSLFATAETTARQQADARARMKEAEAGRRAAEQAAASAEPVKPATPAPAPPPPSAPVAPSPARSETVAVPDETRLARDAALAVLRRYVSALEHRDIGALKAVWPGLQAREQNAIESEFDNARSVSVTFSNPRVEVTGTTATVSGLRQYALRTRDGQDLRSETLTTLALKRAGNDWVIDSVRHQPAR